MYQSLGKYTIQSNPIGRGSFSEVYKGFETQSQRKVAVKKMLKSTNQKYIRSEIQLMKQFRSPYILQLLNVVRDKYHVYLILEYCSQGNLKSYIESPMTEYNLLYIYQIISGLKYLFHKNIIHRDIKPENILLHNHTVKICDFGFAKTLKDVNLLSTFCGSPLYMAPEILSFNKYTDKADMWSLGVILYEILTKQHPYPCKNKVQLAQLIKSPDEVLVNTEVCKCDRASLVHLIRLALRKKVTERLEWTSLFSSAWYSEFSEENELLHIASLAKSTFGLGPDSMHVASETLTHRGLDPTTLEFEDLFASCNSDAFGDSEVHNHADSYNDEGSSSNLLYLSDTSGASDRIVGRTSNSYSVSSSEHGHNIICSCYEDSKVYSQSAPHVLQSDYLESMSQQRDSAAGRYSIIGNSPNLQRRGSFMKYLGHSVSKIKNMFSIT